VDVSQVAHGFFFRDFSLFIFFRRKERKTTTRVNFVFQIRENKKDRKILRPRATTTTLSRVQKRRRKTKMQTERARRAKRRGALFSPSFQTRVFLSQPREEEEEEEEEKEIVWIS